MVSTGGASVPASHAQPRATAPAPAGQEPRLGAAAATAKEAPPTAAPSSTSLDSLNFLHAAHPPRPKLMTTPSGKLIGPRQRKIALLGSRSVGKSSLTVQFVDGAFVDSYYPTIEGTFQKTVKYKGQDFQLDIIDTAGQDEFSILQSRHAVGLHGFVLVYDCSSRSSFEMCQIIRDKILDYTGRTTVPMVLVGNKSDLAVQRQVTEAEGKERAASWGADFVESSARHNQRVDLIFESVVAKIEQDLNPEITPKEGGSCNLM